MKTQNVGSFECGFRMPGLRGALVAGWVFVAPMTQAASVFSFALPYYVFSPGPSTYLAVEGFPDVAAVYVQRGGTLNTTVGVQLDTAAGTALPGEDYTQISTNLVFVPGEQAKIVFIPILNDRVAEPFETFQVNLSHPSEGNLLGSPKSVTVRLTDNDQGVQFENPAYTVNEDAGQVTIRVRRPDEGGAPVTVDYATVDRTAVAGVDYGATHGTLEFGADSQVQSLVVPLLNDAVRRPDRKFQVVLRQVGGDTVLGSLSVATVTIQDTDEVVGFASPQWAVPEEAPVVRLAVTRGESAAAGTVDVLTRNAGAVAGVDYVGVSNTLAFAAGERLRTVEVPLLNDGVKESTKGFLIQLQHPTGGVVLGTNRVATVMILDNDPGLGFVTNVCEVPVPSLACEVQVARDRDDWLGPFTVDYATSDGTAVAGVDYEAAAGTLSFGPGERIQRLPLKLRRHPDGSTSRRFILRLSNATGPLPIARPVAFITILGTTQGQAVWVRPPLRVQAAYAEGRVELSWPGAAAVLRAEAVGGPWEELGVVQSPLVLAAESARGFYQLRSPRTARLYVPSRYDGATPLPLVLGLHGYGGADIVQDYIVDYFGTDLQAEAKGFLACTPTGTTDPEGNAFWNATCEGCNFYGSGVDDSAYLRALIDEIAREYAVDGKRIYVMGNSCGGSMSHRMGCDHADRVAGIASLEGYMDLDPTLRRPREPVNVLVIHSTADEVVPYGGLAAPRTGTWPLRAAQIWAAYNGCSGPVWDPQPVMDLELFLPGLDTTVLRYTNSPPGGAVELWTIHSASHYTVLHYEARRSEFMERVWDWFLAHPKP